jgi:hypothetical protein
MQADSQNPDPSTFLRIPIPDTATIAASRLSSELALDRFGLSLWDVLFYMNTAQIVLLYLGRPSWHENLEAITTPDLVDSSGAPTSVGYCTDGVWVWSFQAKSYVERYGMALPADFLERVSSLVVPPDVSDEVQAAARADLLTREPDDSPDTWQATRHATLSTCWDWCGVHSWPRTGNEPGTAVLAYAS